VRIHTGTEVAELKAKVERIRNILESANQEYQVQGRPNPEYLDQALRVVRSIPEPSKAK